MGSAALDNYNAYVDSRQGSLQDHAELKEMGETLFRSLFREMVLLMDSEGDADVAANPGNIVRSNRHTEFKGWWAFMRGPHVEIQKQLEPEDIE